MVTQGRRLRFNLLRRMPRATLFAVLAGVLWGLAAAPARSQTESGGADAGSCALKDHVYTCNGAAFQAALASASTVAVEVHNSDGVARAQLTSLVTKKLGKTMAPAGTPADLIFLMIPIDPSGVVDSGNEADLGTLRVYSSTPDGGRGHLLWAETYSGAQDLPWPAVVHGLILQFQAHFHIK